MTVYSSLKLFPSSLSIVSFKDQILIAQPFVQCILLAELVMHAKVAFLHFDSVCSVKPNLAQDGQVYTNL